jgi:hypothetical protein
LERPHRHQRRHRQITGAQATLDPAVAAAGSIGQVFGSAIGRALAPNNPFVQLAAGTVAGAIGQAFGQVLMSSLNENLSKVAVGDVFTNFGVSVAGAAASSVASYLTAELGIAIGLTGYGAQLFNAAVGGYAGSVLNQVVRDGLGSINSATWSSALNSAEVSIAGALGSILAHQIVTAHSQAGAIGGQLIGAVGRIIGATIGQSLGLALGVILPGVGSLIGTTARLPRSMRRHWISFATPKPSAAIC